MHRVKPFDIDSEFYHIYNTKIRAVYQVYKKKIAARRSKFKKKTWERILPYVAQLQYGSLFVLHNLAFSYLVIYCSDNVVTSEIEECVILQLYL